MSIQKPPVHAGVRIVAVVRTVRDLLENKRYKLDYYQREYRWEERHIEELIDDLIKKFNELL